MERATAASLWIGVTHGLSARLLLRGQLKYLHEKGFEVTVVGSPGSDLETAAEREGVRALEVDMRREISPWRDLRALIRLILLLRAERPQIVCAGTPKAGLLLMLAAKLTSVPVRIYLLRGLRLETASGLRRAILRATERLAAACSGTVICVSRSLRERYLDLGLTAPSKARVLGSGSSNGVDLERFEDVAGAPSNERAHHESERENDAKVVGFVGRLTRDKGITDLIQAYDIVRAQISDARLLLVGGFEDGDPVEPATVRRIESDEGIIAMGEVTEPERYYQAMDLLAFPSYREGLPNAPLEAAASGRPTVGYRVTGTVDAVVDGVTGELVEAGDTDALAGAIINYLNDPARTARDGAAARQRAATEFHRERVWRLWRDEYARQLTAAGLAAPQAETAGELGVS